VDLHSYAAALAEHLPGTWEADHHKDVHPDMADLVSLLVLRPGQVFGAIREATILINPARPISLLVTETLHPAGLGYAIRSITFADGSCYAKHLDDGEVPELLALGDPSAAAADITRVLLPRHDQLLAGHRLTMLEGALRGAQQAVDHWDSISDSLCDEQGWPLDDQLYGDGVVRRDAAALRHLQDVLPHADALLRDGRAARAGLPPGPAADVANWHLVALTNAFASAAEILHRWDDTLMKTTTANGYNEALEERNAEAWHATHIWLSHGPALTALLRGAAEPGGATRHAAAQERSPRQATASPAMPAEPRPSTTIAKRGPEQRR
jgi:hypothetical protein